MIPIPWYEWRYSAKKDGSIFSHITNKYIKPAENCRGYTHVSLCKYWIAKNYTVHRLICLTFLWASDLQVNHKNWIKTDNRLDNLEYCTASENLLHMYKLGYKRSKKQTAHAIKIWKLRSKKVAQFTIDNKFIREWDSAMEAGRNGYRYQCISLCCLWKLQTSWGYKWKFV